MQLQYSYRKFSRNKLNLNYANKAIGNEGSLFTIAESVNWYSLCETYWGQVSEL